MTTPPPTPDDAPPKPSATIPPTSSPPAAPLPPIWPTPPTPPASAFSEATLADVGDADEGCLFNPYQARGGDTDLARIYISTFRTPRSPSRADPSQDGGPTAIQSTPAPKKAIMFKSAQSDPHDEPYSWVVDVTEAARIAQCSEETIVDAINDRHLPAHRLSGNRRWRIMREDLPVWLRQQSQRRSDP